MKEKMTGRAKKVLSLASAEAVKLRHPYVGTEHLLLGLLREGTGVAAKVLESLGLDLRAVRTRLEEVVAPGKEDPPSPPLPFTPKGSQALELASEYAGGMGHNYVGTEHLLLGLVSQHDGVAAQVLADMGVDGDRIRQQVQRLLTGGDSASAAQDADDLPPLPSIDMGEDSDTPAALSDDGRLCMAGLDEVQELKALAQAAGEILRRKDEAVADENFELAARLRDAMAALGRIVGEARDKWQASGGAPDEDDA